MGGIETVVQVIASQWNLWGFPVSVVTQTPSDTPNDLPFPVLRTRSLWETVRHFRQQDAVLLANISLWGVLPLLFCGNRRPAWVATHHSWYQDFGRPIKPLDRLKKALAHLADANISVSRSVDQFLQLSGHVIPNAYDIGTFQTHSTKPRSKDLVFLGRFVSDKGADLLLDALGQLRTRGLTPSLTLIGAGPEEQKLREQTHHLGLDMQVTFAGPQTGAALVRLLNEHTIMVVPSRWNEPFGIVALEGIACGCLVVGSSGGGLPDAIGDCGMTFPNGDLAALTETLASAMQRPTLRDWATTDTIRTHLARHHPEQIARAYAAVVIDAMGQSHFQPALTSLPPPL